MQSIPSKGRPFTAIPVFVFSPFVFLTIVTKINLGTMEITMNNCFLARTSYSINDMATPILSIHIQYKNTKSLKAT